MYPARTSRALDASNAAVAIIATATAACAPSSHQRVDQRADVVRVDAARAAGRLTALSAGTRLKSTPAASAAIIVATSTDVDGLKS